MHHGRRLTPLGQQLRTVLNGLSAAAKPEPSRRGASGNAATAQITFFDTRYDGARRDALGLGKSQQSSVKLSPPSRNPIPGTVVAASKPLGIQSASTRETRIASEKKTDARQSGRIFAGAEAIPQTSLQKRVSSRTKPAVRRHHRDKLVEQENSPSDIPVRVLKKFDDRRRKKRMPNEDLSDALTSVGLEELAPYAHRTHRRNTVYADKSMQDGNWRGHARQSAIDAGIESIQHFPVVHKAPTDQAPSPLNAMTTAIQRDAIAEKRNAIDASIKNFRRVPIVHKAPTDRVRRFDIADKQNDIDVRIKHFRRASIVHKAPNNRAPSPLYAMTAAAIRRDDTADEHNDFTLAEWEQSDLKSRGYHVGDLQVWSQVLKELDAAVALRTLIQCDNGRQSRAAPLFVFHHILRRDYLSGTAIREALDYLQILIDRLAPNDEIFEYTQFIQPLQLISSRLIKHALNVWPQALCAIVDSFLECHSMIEQKRSSTTEDRFGTTTHFLNCLMGQISLPPTELRFKAIGYQHEAIVRILRHLSEQQPVIPVSREGYRAVIRVQLAQQKTAEEQEWAELKALSWPPWKHDRTGMDADIGPERGISRAGATLNQMREAGYPWMVWEQTASIYAGWDTDRSPTIQTRRLLGRDRHQDPNDEGIWAARITATRTMQEAWACYLSWEDEKLAPAQPVYLAVFRKILAQEQCRFQGGNGSDQDEDSSVEPPAWPLYPGDTLTVEPLPPSTHLYTYTRTSPPTMNQLYEQLHARGIKFSGDTLAFLVANADNVMIGLKYLGHAAQHSPELHVLLSRTVSAATLSATRESVLIATIDLLSRFPHEPFFYTLAEGGSPAIGESTIVEPIALFSEWQLLRTSCIARAIELLRARPLTNRHAWHSLLRHLTRPHSLKSLRHVIARTPGIKLFDHSHPSHGSFWDDDNTQHDVGAIVAYQLARETLTLARQNHIPLDTLTFDFLCRTTEKMALASCSLLQRHGERPSRGPYWPPIQRECLAFLSSVRAITSELEFSFQALTSVRTSTASTSSSSSLPLPQLVCPPNPSTLHGYIRVLGHLGTHDRLLGLVQWMAQHRGELLERQNLDRSGARMMRRAIVAVRVALEGKFLSSAPGTSEKGTGEVGPEQASLFADPPPAEASSGMPPVRRWEGGAGGLVRRLRRAPDEDLVQSVRQILGAREVREVWGGWPTEEECAQYCDRMYAATARLHAATAARR